VRVGAGPQRLLDDGLQGDLAARGVASELQTIDNADAFEGEIGRSFELKRRIASAVAQAVADNRFPLVLAGNCNSTVGVCAGLPPERTGVIWFDAHPDFDTPEEHRSGYFDGMGAATLTGRCWKAMAATVPGHRPLADGDLVYCGIRDFEPGQAERVRDCGIAAVMGSTEHPTDFIAGLRSALDGVAFDRAVIHLDLDCLDTAVGHANEYAAPGGLSAEQLLGCIGEARRRVRPVAMTVASFNPRLEGADRISAAGRAAIVAAIT
jgi:arginase